MRDNLASAARWDGTDYGAVRMRADVSLHFLDEGGVVLDARSQRIFRFDRFSTLVWCLFAECRTVDRVKRRLVQTHGLSREAANRNVDIAVADWRRQGLLHGPRPDPTAARVAAPTGDAMPPGRPGFARPQGGGDAAQGLGLRIAGLQVFLDIHGAPDPTQLQHVFAHLSIGRDSPPDHCCALLAESDGYCLATEDRILARCASETEIVPMVKAGLVALASEAVDAPAAIHAAALAKDGRAIVLPGAAGAGKSTLAAALVHDGFDLAGDDTVFLSAECGHVRPMPFGICLKDQAWPVLAGRIGDLDGLPVFQRADGQIVRYVVPRRHGGFDVAMDPLPIGSIVFPRFEPGRPPACRRLSAGEALERLLPQVFPKGQRFDAQLIEHLIAMLDGVDLFAASYGDLPGAVAAVRQAVA